MKAVLASIVLLAAALAQGDEVKLKLSGNGMDLGTAVFGQSVTKSGQLHQTIKIVVELTGFKGSLDGDILTDAAGRAISDTSVDTQNGKKVETKLTYSGSKLTIKKTEDGKTTTTMLDIPKGDRADASSWWFVTTRPKQGDTASFLHYNKREKKWETQSSTYVGDETVPGTKIQGHHIHHDDGESWVDDKGMPIRMELNDGSMQMVLVRS